MQIDIRCRERDILRGIQEWARRRVLFAIGQFGSRVRAVRVQIDDENGPKGGIDQRCLMEARLLGGGTIIARVHDADASAAISRAADRLGRCIRSAIERARSGRRAGAGQRRITGPRRLQSGDAI